MPNRVEIKIPATCDGCKLKGRDAIRCLIYPTLDEIIANLVPCAAVGATGDEQIFSGGVFNPRLKRPTGRIHQASRVGSGGRKR